VESPGVAFKFAIRYLVTARVKSGAGALAKAVADRTAQGFNQRQRIQLCRPRPAEPNL